MHQCPCCRQRCSCHEGEKCRLDCRHECEDSEWWPEYEPIDYGDDDDE